MGRPREVVEDTEIRTCPKHGVGDHRLHANGWTKTGLQRWDWRCVRCLRDRYKPRSRS